MSIIPPYLTKGAKVAITCPAKRTPKSLDKAIEVFKSWGLEVVLGKTTDPSLKQSAEDDNLRIQDIQQFIDDDSIKAIIASHGGYGTIRLIDKLDFSRFAEKPKWIVGYSDVTVLLAHVFATCNVQSIHGQMPLHFPEATEQSLIALKNALFGEKLTYEFKAHELNRAGTAEGFVFGGNLTLVLGLLGSVSDVDYSGKILVLESVGDYVFSIDLALYTLKRAGKLKDLAGLVIGTFNKVNEDEDIPFKQSVPEMVMNVVKEYDYPVCFDFPAGHIEDNQAFVIGRKLRLEVGKEKTSAYYV